MTSEDPVLVSQEAHFATSSQSGKARELSGASFTWALVSGMKALSS